MGNTLREYGTSLRDFKFDISFTQAYGRRTIHWPIHSRLGSLCELTEFGSLQVQHDVLLGFEEPEADFGDGELAGLLRESAGFPRIQEELVELSVDKILPQTLEKLSLLSQPGEQRLRALMGAEGRRETLGRIEFGGDNESAGHGFEDVKGFKLFRCGRVYRDHSRWVLDKAT